MILERTRISWIDTFKTFMIFFVAFGHAVYEGEPVGYACNYYIHVFHVAGFFFVSGYLFSSKKEDLWGFVKKKFTSLMIPYYIFAFISLGIFVLMGSFAASRLNVEISNIDIWKNIVGIFYANGLSGYMKWNLPMWFIPCLFVSLLIFYFIVKLITFLNGKIGKNGSTILVMLALFAFNTINYYWLDIKCLPFGLETALYMFPIMLLGFWIRPYINIDSLKISLKVTGSIVFLGLGGILSLYIGESVSFVSSIYGNLLVFYIACILNIFGFMFLSSLINCKVFDYIGKNTLAILIMHKFPIVFLQMFLDKYMSLSWVTNICISIIITIISVILSLICCELITRIAPFALGKRRKRIK